MLAGLSSRLGKHRAQGLLQDVLRDVPVSDLPEHLAALHIAEADEVRRWLSDDAIAVAGLMVDHVVNRDRS